MCRVNDHKRNDYNYKIRDLTSEQGIEEENIQRLEKAMNQLEQLIEEAQGAIDNLVNCDFGGDKILSSVRTSQQGYKERYSFYDNCRGKISGALMDIINEKEQYDRMIKNLPRNCGSCDECTESNAI